jgi:TRAP-type transport system periplasmic protein
MMFSRKWSPGIVLAVLLVLVFISHPATAKRTKIKMATLAPDGSIWHQHLEKMGEDWLDKTDRRVVLNLYSGGVAGDDPDMVRKMRIGQIQSAALTIKGLASIEPAFNILGIPLFYDSYEELEFVLRQIEPQLKNRLENKGFVLLNWIPTGWAYFFSKKPVETISDLQKMRLFAWAGEDRMVQIWKNNSFNPVALSATDIMTGLQSGMIEAMPSTPLASLSLQWFRSTPYLLNLEIAPVFGAVIINKNDWEKISAQDRSQILAVASDIEKELFEAIPEKDREAIEEMKERGLTVTHPEEGQNAVIGEVAEGFSLEMRKAGIVPEDIYEKAFEARRLFRQREKVAGGSS